MHSEFFLGANSAEGFYSLYDEFCREKGGYLHLIKGGPGGGKSGFMRKIGKAAEEAGYDVEYVLCSGDPASLDGVYITQLNIGYVDATSPHALEPDVFGVNCDYVNLGQFFRPCGNPDIEKYTKLYKQMYTTAYSYLKAADCANNAEICGIFDNFAINKVKTRANNTLKRELGGGKYSCGKITRRFIRCISCEGEIILHSTLSKLCKHIFSLDDRFGLEQIYFDEVAHFSTALDRIVCPSPLNPRKTDAVLFPQIGLGFVSSSLMGELPVYRHIRLDALADCDACRRQEVRRRERLYRELAGTACDYLKRAKKYHDLLEEAYRPCIDFPSLTEFTEREIERVIFRSE